MAGRAYVDGGQPLPPDVERGSQQTLLFPLIRRDMGVRLGIFLDGDGGQPLPIDTLLGNQLTLLFPI